jgi:hypothetical protein
MTLSNKTMEKNFVIENLQNKLDASNEIDQDFLSYEGNATDYFQSNTYFAKKFAEWCLSFGNEVLQTNRTIALIALASDGFLIDDVPKEIAALYEQDEEISQAAHENREKRRAYWKKVGSDKD